MSERKKERTIWKKRVVTKVIINIFYCITSACILYIYINKALFWPSLSNKMEQDPHPDEENLWGGRRFDDNYDDGGGDDEVVMC